MRRKSISQLVHAELFPPALKSSANAPIDFKTHVAKNIVPEVRTETKTFYGTFDCIEARYPGLDYAHPAHRMRLGRFKHHERLFRAFDALALSEKEIAGLCTWEGTRSARENYEREEGIKVHDTTGDEIEPWVAPANRLPAQGSYQSHPRVEVMELAGAETEDIDQDNIEGEDDDNDDNDDIEEGGDEEDGEEADASESELEIESVGLELNRRLEAAAEASGRGVDVVMDPEFEQWLKEATERGLVDSTNLLRAGVPFPSLAAAGSDGAAASNTGVGSGSVTTSTTSTRTGTAM